MTIAKISGYMAQRYTTGQTNMTGTQVDNPKFKSQKKSFQAIEINLFTLFEKIKKNDTLKICLAIEI